MAIKGYAQFMIVDTQASLPTSADVGAFALACGLLVSNGASAPSNTSFSPALPGGTVIKANVTTGATATNDTVLYDILGFYDT